MFFLQLVTDTDLLLPIAERSKGACIWIAREAAGEDPRICARARATGAVVHEVAADRARTAGPRDLEGARAVVTASETTARPHRWAHGLTRGARSVGIPTYTLQHGFENIGLTWFDRVHSAASIRFASDRILAWGGRDTLHPDTPPETAEKTVAVGCPKPVGAGVSGRTARARTVGVFENLHWHRYDDSFRAAFLRDLAEAACALPDWSFTLVPHPAGRWSTERFEGDLPGGANLRVCRDRDDAAGPYAAVITTPSTVAVDAARAGVPVAVAAPENGAGRYEPLSILSRTEDWADFLRRTETDAGEDRARGRAFLDRWILPGDAIGRILSIVEGA